MTSPTMLALRRCALAVSVLYDLDVVPTGHGVELTGLPKVRVSWRECRRAIAGTDPESPAARERLVHWLRLRRWVADRPVEDVAERARPYGMYVYSPLHPGLDWVQHRVLGDALDVGIAVVGLDPARPDDVVPVPRGVFDAAGVDAEAWWPTAAVYLEHMGAMAADRYRRDPQAPLRPMGDCDVVTLLAARSFRLVIVDDAQGMRPVAVPMRTRGWLDLSRIDPAFAVAAAAATDPRDRGFPRPLLVTRDEVALAAEGGRPADMALRDPAPPPTWLRDVRYR